MKAFLKLLRHKNPLCLDTKWTRLASQLLFYICYVTVCVIAIGSYTQQRRIMDADFGRMVLRVLSWCVTGTVANVVLLCRYTIGQTAAILIFFRCLLEVYHVSHNQLVPIGLAMIFAARHVRWKQLLKVTLVTWVVTVLVVVIGFYIGRFPPGPEIFRSAAGYDVLRQTFGFGQPNYFGYHIFYIVQLWGMIRARRTKWFEYVLWGYLALFIWFYPNSRTSTMGILTFMALLFVLTLFGDLLLRSRIVCAVWAMLYPAVMAVVCLIGKYFNRENMTWFRIDELMSNRCLVMNYFYKEYQVFLFGSNEQRGDTDYHIMDCWYDFILYRMGGLITVVCMALFVYLMWRAARSREYGALAAMTSMAFYSISENMYGKMIVHACYFLLVWELFRNEREDSRSVQRERLSDRLRSRKRLRRTT